MSNDRLWALVARKLAGESSPEEMNELSALLAANPDLHLQVQMVMNTWQNENETDMQGLNNSYQDLLNRLKSNGFEPQATVDETGHFELGSSWFSRNRKLVMGLAGLSVVAMLISFFALLQSNKVTRSPVPHSYLVSNSNSVISTKNGSRTKVELPDGSTAWLNAGSKLTYNKQFGNQYREVQLSGEGFFDIVHDENKPFIIRTELIDIKDLGTQFNVKCYPNEKTTEVSLVQGSVEITMKKTPGDKWVLKPNEKISLQNPAARTVAVTGHNNVESQKEEQPILTLAKVNIDKAGEISEVGWVKNKLVFVNESMDLLASKMERWFDKSVVVQNPNLNNLHFTATFENESIDQVLKALQLSSGHKMNFSVESDKVIIY